MKCESLIDSKRYEQDSKPHCIASSPEFAVDTLYATFWTASCHVEATQLLRRTLAAERSNGAEELQVTPPQLAPNTIP